MRFNMNKAKETRFNTCFRCKHFRSMRKERGLCMFFSKVVHPIEDRCQTAFEPKVLQPERIPQSA